MPSRPAGPRGRYRSSGEIPRHERSGPSDRSGRYPRGRLPPGAFLIAVKKQAESPQFQTAMEASGPGSGSSSLPSAHAGSSCMPVDSRWMRDAPTTATQTADASPARAPSAASSPHRRADNLPDAERIFMKLGLDGCLPSYWGIAAFCGGLMEARQCWHGVLALLMGRA